MGSEDVFISLKELFPQVDHRILKAVSIEHANDVDAAVEFIVSDVLPRFSGPPKETQGIKQSSQKGSFSQAFLGGSNANEIANQLSKPKAVAFGTHLYDSLINNCVTSLMEETTSRDLCASKPYAPSFLANFHKTFGDGGSSMHSGEGVEYEVPLISDHPSGALHCTSSLMDKRLPVGSLSNLQDGNSHYQLFSDDDQSENRDFGTNLKDDTVLQIQNSNSLHDSFQELDCLSGKATFSPSLGGSDDDQSIILENMSDELGSVACSEKDTNGSLFGSEKLTSCSADPANIQDSDRIEYKFADKDAFPSPQEANTCVLENCISSVQFVDSAIEEFNCSTGIQEFQLGNMTEKVADLPSLSDNDCQITNLSTKSSQIVSIDFLEDFIADAKTNKKVLLSAIESTIDMMKDVELEEERAKQAKVEASKAGEDILSKVEELREILKHSKEANDMHAGEVYGEKSILATESRELQSRLLGLSNERDKSFRIIKEIEETLKERLTTAKKEIAAAEQEKLEKERLAQKALSEQEQLMDAIVQESKALQQQAEENSKLREFLMERGQIVDTLQGEIAVICEDVLSLKERVDGRIPLSRSLLSRTGSLASSLSSSSSSRTSLSGRKSPSMELKDSPNPNSNPLATTTQQLLKSQELKSSTNSGKTTSGEKHGIDLDWELFECPILDLVEP
ncbi:UBA-like protein [Dioscorea alata]|uniref:UBA-like protein n=2 Tax=Dioscorea alata TaxID=55571 RepID=A0ACB7VRB0_DIOAL|nr:UBA-like protein [Dioscorea alata]KAH7676950.1 UBA-like protein [Dioscorea alata]